MTKTDHGKGRVWVTGADASGNLVINQRPMTGYVRSFPVSQAPGFCCVELQLLAPAAEAELLISGLLFGKAELVLEHAETLQATTYKERATATEAEATRSGMSVAAPETELRVQ